MRAQCGSLGLAAAYFHRRKIYWQSEWNERSSFAGLKENHLLFASFSPLSPSLLWPKRYLISLMFENKIKCKKIIYYLQSSRCCTPLCASFFLNSVPICIPRQFSFTPARLLLLQFYFVYYVKHRRALLRMKFLFHIFFVVIALVCLCSRYCNTVKKRNSHSSEPCCMSDRCCSFFFWRCTQLCSLPSSPLDHGMTTKTMMMMTAVLWCKERKRNQTKEGQHKRFGQYSPLLLPSCMHTGWRKKRRNEIELFALEKHKTSHFHFYNSPQPDRTEGEKEKEQQNSCNFILNDAQMSDGILFLPSISSAPSLRPQRATLQTLFILSWAVVSCFFFLLFSFFVWARTSSF